MSSGVIARYEIVNPRLISSVRIRCKLYRELQKKIAYVHSTQGLRRFAAPFMTDTARAARPAADDGDANKYARAKCRKDG
jgi:hypothetical protein